MGHPAFWDPHTRPDVTPVPQWLHILWLDTTSVPAVRVHTRQVHSTIIAAECAVSALHILASLSADYIHEPCSSCPAPSEHSPLAAGKPVYSRLRPQEAALDPNDFSHVVHTHPAAICHLAWQGNKRLRKTRMTYTHMIQSRCSARSSLHTVLPVQITSGVNADC